MIGLISCCKSKVDGAQNILAKDLYQGALFKAGYQYLRSRKVEKIFILSAQYGLIPETELISYYEKRVPSNDFENKSWAKQVLQHLSIVANLENDYFVIMAGNDYKRNLLPALRHFECPLEGHGGLGSQLHWLNEVNRKNG